MNVSDDVPERQLRSALTPERIDGMSKLIAFDRRAMHDEIETSLNISRTLLNSILHNNFKRKKVCSS